MSVKERLKEYLKFKKVSERSFAEKIGVSSGYVNAISKSIQPEKVHSISIFFPDLSITWLLTGEGEMLNNEEKNYSKGDNVKTECYICKQKDDKIELLTALNESFKKHIELLEKTNDRYSSDIDRLNAEIAELKQQLNEHKTISSKQTTV